MTDETKKVVECLECLRIDIESKDKKTVLSFEEFLGFVRAEPQRVLRNIFQLFYDMVQVSIIKGEDEYPDDPESIGYVKYDCSKIFVEGTDSPFFVDRPFANRFVNQVKELSQGSQQNRMYVYLGPPGCGKSTFLNNLLQKFEEYTQTKGGQSFEFFWDIEIKSQKIEVPCPSHDHPILIIPKAHRAKVLEELLAGVALEIRDKITKEKEYEWLFSGKVCTICESIFDALFEKLGSLDKVLSMIKVRPYEFNRRIGEGISVFNPGDKPAKELYLSNKQIQKKLDQIFGMDRVKYVFSQLARTNNGIYVLMDIKGENEPRLFELHNVISEEVHKVYDILEERITSLFFALMNPEDAEKLKSNKDQQSFVARISWGRISYLMEVAAEISVYRDKFGEKIDSYFLPRVMDNFAKIIISSRMHRECKPLNDWIKERDVQQYSADRYCDKYGILLRMEIYSGIIPTWLSEEDKKRFTAEIRRNLIAEAANEGIKEEGAFTGRHSIEHFGKLLSLYGPKKPDGVSPRLIRMSDVADYFKRKIDRDFRDKNIPPDFIASVVDQYDYMVLNEVKEALYFYNNEQIQEDILHYLYAINYDPDGRKLRCPYTGKDIEVTVEFFKMMGFYITGESMGESRVLSVAKDIQRKYIATIARDRGQKITETELYKELFATYARNLKEKVLEPFLENDNFREAIKLFGTKEFESFDTRLKEHVTFMIDNLVKKLGYTKGGAKEICLYLLEQDIPKKFS